MQRPDRVWYLAYGSNLNEQRFLRYLTGDDDHQGARDPSPARSSRWVQLPFELTFERESRRWGAGVAFVHPSETHRTWFRAWDITGEQFEDVCAQENRRPVGGLFDWSVMVEPAVDVGTGWYGRILQPDAPELAPYPALTFTSADRQAPNPPNPAYAETMAAGLADHPHLSPADASTYLAELIANCA